MLFIMKRKSFCRYLALSSVCFTGVLGRDSCQAVVQSLSMSKSYHRWVVLYWMPYDNNLARFGEPIIEMLLQGTKDSQAVVAVQSDYLGDTKMRRRTLINGVIRETDIVGQDSSNVSAFSEYLDWAYQTFDAQHWAVIVVSHGGKINEISPDDSGSTPPNRKWMRVDQLTNAVSRFNQATNKRVELLFFQNCNKATLEVIYEARNCARYTLASQVQLGAPNYYYNGFLKQLNKPSVKGLEAARAIMESERADMYHTLTLVDNHALQHLTAKLSLLIQALQAERSLAVDLSNLSTIDHANERFCDVLVLFNYSSQNKTSSNNALTEFANFLKSSALAYYKTGGEFYRTRHLTNNDLDNLCGLSLYLPKSIQDASRYSLLALYQSVDLISFYKKILTTN
jgi:hypothetical protein